MANNSKRITNFSQAVLYTIIVIAILGAVNFLANRYNKSYDTTSNKQYTLSDQTAKIAKNLKDKVTITYWDQSSKFQGARDLLGRYSNLSSNVDVQYMDADKNRTKAIAAGVKTIPTIYVEVSGNKRQEAKSLTEEEITGALVRVLAPWLFPEAGLAAILISAILWSAGFAVYAVRYGRYLIKPRLDGRPG